MYAYLRKNNVNLNKFAMLSFFDEDLQPKKKDNRAQSINESFLFQHV